MALYAISDLHLSFCNGEEKTYKPMDIFGENWKSHYKKIEKNWNVKITDEDTVLIAGDVSWGRNLIESENDFAFIESLKGKKIITCGNHDYWWCSTSLLNKKYNNIYFLRNCYTIYEEYAICGARGWICPNDSAFTDHDKKIYKRELNRVKLSLDDAVKNGYKKIILMLHFPPTNDRKENSGFTDIIKEYNVEKVVYGHLHGSNYFNSSLQGDVLNTEYILTSCDYLNFDPIKIIK